MGKDNTITGNDSFAAGDKNSIDKISGMAVGFSNKISMDNNQGNPSPINLETKSGDYSIAVGLGNKSEKNALVIGKYSNALHDGSIAIGNSVNAQSNNNNGATDSIAIGTGSKAMTKDSIAFGHEARIGNNNSQGINGAIAIGKGANAEDGQSLAIGYDAYTGNNSDVATSQNGSIIAIGTNAQAMAGYDIAIGAKASTASSKTSNSGGSAVAIGYNAVVNDGARRSIAMGANASVFSNVQDAVALGSQSYVEQNQGANHQGGYDPSAKGTAHGDANSSTKDPVWNSTLGPISVGSSDHYVWDGSKSVHYAQQTRQITNVAAGKEDTDAVNVAQLKKVVDLIGNGGSSSTGSSIHDYSVKSVKPDTDTNYENKGATGDNALAAGVSASATGVRSVAVGNGAQALKPDSIALGTNAKADGIGATAIGQYNTASGQNSLAFGGGYNKDQKGNTASGVASVAFGEGTQAIAEGTLAFGQNTQAGVITTDDKGNIQIGGQDAVAFGRGTKALGGRSLAFGEDTVADFNDSVAFGAGTKALSTGSTAFGSRTRALAQYSTALGNSTVAAGTYSVAFGTDTVAGAVLDEHGAFQLKNGTKMDQHGNTAYTDSQGKTYSVTYTVPDGEKHSYVVLKGQGGKTYIRDYRGNIRTATIGNDGSVTVGGIVKGATEDKTLIKAKPGSNGYDLISNSNATAWGESSSASGEASTAFGIGSKAEGKNSLAALGGLAANDNSIAIGEGTKANNADKAVSLAIGQNAEASGERSLAIGFGVSEKVNDKDDKTLTSTKASGESAIAIGTDVVAQGQHSVAMGSHTDAAKDSSVAIGFDTHTVSDSAVAIGSGTRAEGRYSVALGLSSVAGKETNDAKNPLNGGGSVAIGYGTSAEASRSIAIGTGATAADSQFTTAVGDSTIAQAEGSVAIGAGSIATRGAGNKESTASTDVNTGKTTITYGDEKKAYLKPDELSTDKTSTWVSTTGAVSVGGQATYKEYNDNGNLVEKTKLLTRQITNVAAGSDDTDAVNVAQLKAAQPTVTSNDHSVTIDTTTDKTDYHKNYDLKIATATLSQDKTTGDNPVETGKVTVSNPKISVTENGETKQVDNPNAYVTGNSVADAINNSGFKLTASASEGDVTGNAETLIHPGDTMTIDAGKNISLTQTNGKISIATKDKLVLGKDTSDGKDGQEGTIGLTGKDGIPGTDGKQGYSTTIIKTEKGQPGSDGKNGKPGVDGKDITRIVYTDKDGSTPQTVATLSDGLKFAGDDISKTVEKKLNETLQIRGDGSYDKTTQKTKEDGNIQVSADTDTGTIKVALNKDINLKQDGSLTVGGNTQDGSKTVDDPIVIKHFDDKTLDMITGVGEDGKPITAKEGKAGDYVTGLDNKAWDVSNPNYVSGRAATEDQLKKVSDAVNKTAGQHTVVTVNDNKNDHDTKAKAGKGAFGDYAGTDKDNLLIAAKDEDGKLTYNIKLNDQLAIGKNGTDGQDGKDGKDGKVTVETSKGTTVVIGHDGEPGKDGKDGLFVTGQDGKDGKSGVSITGPDGVAGKDGVDGKVGIAGKDGKDAVSITGKDGVGHIGLTGPKGDGTPGRDGTSIDILTDYGTKTLDSNKNVTVDNKEQASRIIYNDAKGPHEVATMDDGLKIGANAAAQGETANPVSNKLNSTINIKGSEAKADHTYTDDNLTTTVEQDADGNTTVKVLMDQDITGNSVTVGKDGKTGYDGQEGSIGIAGKDGKDGKQGITTTIIKTEKGQNGKDGEVGKQGAPGVDGKDITRIVYQNGQDGENGQGGKHVVATLDDGLKFAGDNASTTVAKKLNETLQIRGDGTYDKDKKTVADDGNIKTSVEDGTIKVALNKDINLKQTGSLTVGGDTQDGSTDSKDPIVIKHFDDKTLDVIGVDKDGKPTTSKEGKAGDYVTGLDNKDWNVSSPAYVSGRAATEDQLKKVSDAVNSAAATAGKHTVVTVNDKDSNETKAEAGTGAFGNYASADKGNLLIAAKDDNGQMTYNIKLNDQLAIGQKGEPGVAGKDGKDGKVTVETKGGTTVVIGHDGEPGKDGKDGLFVTGKDGADGVSITGPDGAAGTDGKVGIAGTDGKDAVSISGKDGVGHIGLIGPKGADGKNADIDISTALGTATLDPTKNEQSKAQDKVDPADKAARIQYESTVTAEDGTTKTITHEVATMDDGLKFVGDDGTATPVTKKLNDTLQIRGDSTYDATTHKTNDDGNIKISSDTVNGTIQVALSDKINLHQAGALTVGGNKNGGAANGQDPIVIKHFDDKTLDVIGVDKDGKPTTSKEGKAGDYVTGLDNKDWNVSSPAYVSGRAATEDQLKKVSDAVNSAAATAGKHTVVTVNDKDSNNETAAKAGTGAFGDYAGADKGNLLIAAKNDNGQMTYNIKLNDQLAIGQKGEPGVAGKDGKDGKVTVETKGGTTVVIGHDGEDGKDGISVKGQDGKDGVTISAVNGKDGSEGHIGLTGPKGADGKNATADIHVKNGQVGVDGTDGHGGKDGMDRVVYEDHNGVTHEVATMDDGQKYAGDFGDGASVKLNKTVTIKGKVKDGAKEDDFVDGNIAIVANKKGEDGELLIKLNKDLTGLNSATYTTSTKNGDVTTTSKTVVDGTGLKIDNGPSITNTGIDGGSKKITNVADGEISATSKDAVNGSQLNAVKTLAGQHTTVEAGSKNITVKEGTNSTGGKNYTVDLAKDVAFGDSAKGDKTVAISGTNGTVTAGTGDNKVTVDGSKGQIIAGGDNGVKIGNIAGGDSSLTIYDKDGKATNQTDQAGKYVTNLGNKTWNKDGSYVSGRAATEDQLHQVESNVNKQIADVNTKIDKVDKHHTEVTVNGGTPAKADGAYTDGNLQLKQTTGEDGQKVYDLKLNDQLKVGQKGDAGKAGKDGNVTVETKGGTTVVIGHDGKDGKDGRDGLFVTGKDGKDGKSGVSITGPNGAAGTDGVDGKVGIAGKDGRDAVSIAGKDGVGHIGLTGPKGADGKDGTNIDISTVLGKGTLDRNQNEVKGEDKDGTKDQAARIQYQTTVKETDGTTKTITHEVATMDDGMKYGDDFGNTAKVKLNHQLDIVGDINAGKKDGDKKATKDDLSDGNIGIVATDTVYNDDGTVKENGKMTVKLAKNLKGLNSIESNSVTTGNTTINNSGLTVKTGDSTHQDITIQQGDVNMGGNKIEGVAPGKISKDSTDAVNGSQLYAADQAISYLGGTVNKLGTRVDRVGAGSAALAALHPLDFDPDDKWDFAAGYGHYRGANAAAVGAYYRPNEDTMFSIGGSFGGGENMFNAGVSIKLGQGNHVSTSRVAMAKEMEAMRRHMAEQDALIAKLESMHGMAEGPEKSALFPDVAENHWAYQYVTTLAKKGILEGYPDGEFKGDRMMTRYEFAAIVYRIVESGVGSTDPELSKLVREFSPELQYIRIDTIHRDHNGQPTVQRVRVKDRK